jgi:plasmid stabilization system protein ParE
VPDSIDSAADAPLKYSVRLSERGLRDRAESAAWIAEMVGEDEARQWVTGLMAAAATLAEQPRRYAILPRETRRIGRDVRRLLYRRTPGSAAYLVFYALEEEGLDGPRVIIFHIRHGARRPLSAAEGREMRGDLTAEGSQ